MNRILANNWRMAELSQDAGRDPLAMSVLNQVLGVMSNGAPRVSQQNNARERSQEVSLQPGRRYQREGSVRFSAHRERRVRSLNDRERSHHSQSRRSQSPRDHSKAKRERGRSPCSYETAVKISRT